MSILKFRLTVNRLSKKNIMSPAFRSVIEIPQGIELKDTLEVTGIKENNGNIQITITQYFETPEEKEKRIKLYQSKPLKG